MQHAHPPKNRNIAGSQRQQKQGKMGMQETALSITSKAEANVQASKCTALRNQQQGNDRHCALYLSQTSDSALYTTPYVTQHARLRRTYQCLGIRYFYTHAHCGLQEHLFYCCLFLLLHDRAGRHCFLLTSPHSRAFVSACAIRVPSGCNARIVY